MSFSVVLVGGSIRALADSVRRSGGKPIGFDLFADWDLTQNSVAKSIARSSYPAGFRGCLLEHPGLPWMYTGGLENYPELLEELATISPLWGNCGAVVRRVRDPFDLQTLLNGHGIAVPECTVTPEYLPTDGSWLMKPLKGTGGTGITPWLGHAGSPQVGCFWQKRIDGSSGSAQFLGHANGARLLGVTRQLTGTDYLHAAPFQYAGTIGPLAPNAEVHRDLQSLGELLVRQFGLRGLFGIDYVEAEGRAWIIEVNPRYTAALEVLEEATGAHYLAAHRSVFQWSSPNDELQSRSKAEDSRIVAKGVLFATKRGQVRADATCYGPLGWHDDIRFADIPHFGTRFSPGDPILTLMVRGSNENEALLRLNDLARRFEQDFLE